ncbi:Gfo/Idh/MocA family protein [Hoeflea poritis]|uniref:Gfo/Idh/MocA family oxidoreductase n=1 Tax=Hoeflea poritis TaxID=2993659 RepID=A0ABT4VT40_9HYPH|nr:Gfo/Idh/MocA family oxidoreductase [Hoeflea poritis]MDA4847870.1 Gfo/Idh/MocA family oxidoreductase [Hoeflea poritis]
MKTDPAIAVIGCGYWGKNHVRTLSELGALAAVADADAARAEALAGQFGVPARDIERILEDRDIDAVVLALPPQFHAQLALQAIAAGKHVLVEKPIALNVDDAQKVVDAGIATGVTVMTGHVLRFHPAFEALADMVAEGALGTLQYIHSHRVGLGKFHAQNDALWDIAPHDLSLIIALTGEEPSDIRGEGSAVLNHLSDFAHLHLAFPGGIRSHVFAARLNPYRERRLTVIGDKAMAVFDDVAPWAEKLAVYDHKVWKSDAGLEFETADPRYVAVPDGLPLTREIQHFIHCIRTGAPARTPAEEGLAVIRILSAGTVAHD